MGFLYDDINTAIQTKTLADDEMDIFKTFFFNERIKTPREEIIADTLAWNMGGGKYGGGAIFGIRNRNLMRDLFPNLSRYLAKIVEHIKD